MISVVLAVYNSASIVGETVARIVATCEAQGWRYEIIAVDDGSRDESPTVLREFAARHRQVRVVALGRNGGQHAALLAGLRAAVGDPVVCLDDDLQHPPEAIPLLVQAIGPHDAVFARFGERRHPWWRRPGSACMRLLDRYVFGAPPALVVSSFRAFTRPVVDRIVAYRGTSPYIRGQALLAARHPGNVLVVHADRAAGVSSYSTGALVAVVLRVLIEWTRIPALTAIFVGVSLAGAGALSVASTGRWISLAPFALAHGLVTLTLGVVALVVRSKEGGAARVEARSDGPDAIRGRVQEREARVVGRRIPDQAVPASRELSGERGDASPGDERPYAPDRDACDDDGGHDSRGGGVPGTRRASS